MIYEGTSLLPTPFLGLSVPAPAPFPAFCQSKCLCRWGREQGHAIDLVGKKWEPKEPRTPLRKTNKMKNKQNPQPKMAAKLPNGKPQPQSVYKLLHILHSAMYLLRTE